jgi:allantoinase
VDEEDVVKAIREIDSKTVLLFHAEFEDNPTAPSQSDSILDRSLYSTFLNSRPQSLEISAVSLIISLLERFPSSRAHVVHLSAADALPDIRTAKAKGLHLTVETCFHYLCLDSASIPNGRPEFKCCPPIRDRSNCDKLWGALLDGTIDCVVSDHSPCIASLKRVETDGDFMSAWGGISTLGLGLSLLWTEGRERGVKIGQIVRWMSERTALHAGLHGSKGAIREGLDADLVVFDLEKKFIVG